MVCTTYKNGMSMTRSKIFTFTPVKRKVSLNDLKRSKNQYLLDGGLLAAVLVAFLIA